jgi:hypothetical protein
MLHSKVSVLRIVSPWLVALGFLCPSGETRADDKQSCVRNYEESQHHLKANQFAEAQRELMACTQTCPASLRTDCLNWLEDAERRTPTLLVVAHDSAGHEVTAVRVLVDDERVRAQLDGRPIPLDPGDHRVRFELDGAPTVVQRLTLLEGDRNHRVVIDFGANPIQRSLPPEKPRVTPIPAVALGLGAAGLLALAFGVVSGMAAEAKHASLNSECNPSDACPLSAQGELDGFRTLRTWSTVAYVVGALGLVGGAVVWVTEATATRGSVTVGLSAGPLSAGVVGNF